ncbi:MAG TPA: aldo/keto reductase [Anaerolineae bacterium]|nr:aldo/keto reductase [Anaerolineae bacterium]
MEFRTLGSTGLLVSELCLGTMTFCWTSTEQESYEVMDTAFAAGINFFDTADVYSRWAPGNPGGVAEEIIGKWLKMRRIPRDQIIIATKVRGRMWEGPDGEGLSRVHIMRAVEDSLRRLQLDVIDLYQSHHPAENTPQDETLRAFDDLIKQGKVRFIGCSNYKAHQLREALEISKQNHLARYESLQPHYNLIWRGEFEHELQALCAQEHIGVIPYSPLQAGFLTGKYKRGQPIPPNSRGASNERIQNWLKDERALTLLDTLSQVSQARGETMTVTALAWMLTNPVVSSAIIGASHVSQLQESLAAVGKRLSQEEMQKLNQVSDWS